MPDLLHCAVCGTVLTGGLDTFGPLEQPVCQEHFLAPATAFPLDYEIERLREEARELEDELEDELGNVRAEYEDQIIGLYTEIERLRSTRREAGDMARLL